MGVGSSYGVESTIHTIQDHLERHPNHTLLSLDYVNGFNSMFRQVMLQRLYAQPGLAVLWRLSDFCYGAPSSLHFFDRGDRVATFESQRGARQGCVLGSLLFCLGLQPALAEATQDLPDVTLKAYVDDVSAAGPVEQIAVALSRIRSSAPSLGLHISQSKSSLLWPASTCAPPLSLVTLAETVGVPLLQGMAPSRLRCWSGRWSARLLCSREG